MSGTNDNFIKCPPEAVEWETRKLRIQEEILRYSPTILCLEEVDMFEFLSETLAAYGYVGIFSPKPKSPCLEFYNNMGPDGCALFYKSSLLTLCNSSSFTLQEGDKKSNQVAIFAQFQTKGDTPRQFYTGLTHLKAKEGFHENRKLQGESIAAYISKNCNEGPVIFCGDFNAEPSEPVYQIMQSLDLESTYTYLSQDKKSEPKFTTWKIRPKHEVCHVIDYIWFSRSGFKVKSVLDIPSDAEVGENRLPSLKYPSDHCSLVCDLVFM